MTNLYFQLYNQESEQDLVEDLIDESIQAYGVQAFYLPQRVDSQDTIMNDVTQATYYAAYPLAVYIRNVTGFAGQGDFLSKFGLELRDQVTFTVARREFKRGVVDHDANYQINGTYMGQNILRPKENDIIFLPLNEKFYQIRFVEHEAIFYQLGKLQTFDLQCEVYAPSGETFSTKVPIIDQKASLTLQIGSTATINDAIISEFDDNNSIAPIANSIIDFNEDGVESDPFGDSSISPIVKNP